MAKTKTYTFVTAARSEAVRVTRWYEQKSLHAGPAFVAALRRLLDLIVQFPGLGEVADDTRRIAQVAGYPYLVLTVRRRGAFG